MTVPYLGVEGPELAFTFASCAFVCGFSYDEYVTLTPVSAMIDEEERGNKRLLRTSLAGAGFPLSVVIQQLFARDGRFVVLS